MTIRILQIKVTLAGIKPLVWRRFLVKEDITFQQLHEIVQIVMGWTNTHLYEFEIDGRRILDFESIDDDIDEEIDFNSSDVQLDEFITEENQRFDYMYDFGDGWAHQIVIEKILPDDGKLKHPVCLAGKRNCPPEDCGGPYGYEEFLEAIKNPDHPEHDTMTEWIGGSFDPEEFDLDMVNKRLTKI